MGGEDNWTVILFASAAVLFAARLYYSLRGQIVPLQLADKHVLITGGSSGLGKELAKECYFRGAKVTVFARNRESLLASLNEIERQSDTSGLGSYLQVFDVDVTNEDEVEKAIKRAETRFGSIFMLLACAGQTRSGYMTNTSISCFREMIEANYIGVVNVLHPVARRMCETEKGHIGLVLCSEVYAPLPGVSAFTASKAAVRSLAESLKPELDRFNVKMHLFIPGPIDTPGYRQGNVFKPQLIKQIQGPPISVERACSIFLNGISAGDFHITTSDWLSTLRISASGAISRNSFFLDMWFAAVSVMMASCYAWWIDYTMSRAKVRFSRLI
jgi:3-dehydrosphinganine reductase